MTMTPDGIFAFVRSHRLAVLATVSEDGLPEAALMGFAMTRDGQIVLDTSRESRKFENLRRRSDVALVVGLEDEVTVQLEGRAHEPTGNELARCKAAYFEAFPDGREREA
jgi:general stress protein 26